MKKIEAIREAKRIKKIEKLGAVSMKEFESLQQDVKLQRYGFLAIAALEAVRLAIPKKKRLSQEDIDLIAAKVTAAICNDQYTPEDGGAEDEN